MLLRQRSTPSLTSGRTAAADDKQANGKPLPSRTSSSNASLNASSTSSLTSSPSGSRNNSHKQMPATSSASAAAPSFSSPVVSPSAQAVAPATAAALIDFQFSAAPAQGLMSFPTVVNSNEGRILAGFNLVLGLVVAAQLFNVWPAGAGDATLDGPSWLLLFLWLSNASVPLFGPCNPFAPQGVAARLVAVRFPLKPAPAAPKRFTSCVMVGFLTAQVIMLQFCSHEPFHIKVIPIGILLVFLALNAIVGFCVGCYVYVQLVNHNLVPASYVAEYRRPRPVTELLSLYMRHVPVCFVDLGTQPEHAKRSHVLDQYKQSKRSSKDVLFVSVCEAGICRLRKVVRNIDSNKWTFEDGSATTQMLSGIAQHGKEISRLMQESVDQFSSQVLVDSAPKMNSDWTVDQFDSFKRRINLREPIVKPLPPTLASMSAKPIPPMLGNARVKTMLHFKHPFQNKIEFTSNSDLVTEDSITDMSDVTVDAFTVSPSEVDAALQEFLAKTPEFATTNFFDMLRIAEYPLLDEQKILYLDYTAGGLFAQSQVEAHLDLLRQNVLSNPHSACPCSLTSSYLDSMTRSYLMSFFGASPENYEMVITANASNALKMVGEYFPFEHGSHFMYSADNHNSVVGIRECCKKVGGTVSSVPIHRPDLRLRDDEVLAALDRIPQNGAPHLFAYPGQSNVSGVKHSLHWVKEARKRGWHVLVDTAALASSTRINLDEVQPDFASISFYKIIGYPTGLGALFVRKPIFAKLRKTYFAGGTVRMVTAGCRSPDNETAWLAENFTRLEDGTTNYLGIPAVFIGLKYMENVDMNLLGLRIRCLTGLLIDKLLELKHDNGAPLCEVYGPRTTEMRGGTVAFNLLTSTGKRVFAKMVEHQCNRHKVNVRVGCFCNPGCVATMLGMDLDAIIAEAQLRPSTSTMGDVFSALSQSTVYNAIRCSLGIATNFEDIYRFVSFIKIFKDEVAVKSWMDNYVENLCPPTSLC